MDGVRRNAILSYNKVVKELQEGECSGEFTVYPEHIIAHLDDLRNALLVLSYTKCDAIEGDFNEIGDDYELLCLENPDD